MEWLLILAGLVLLLGDLFIFATGLLALLGFAGIVGGMFLLYSLSAEIFWILLAVFVILFVGLILLLSLAPYSYLGRRLTLHFSLKSKEGFVSSSHSLKKFIGKEGRARSVLRPGGTVIIDGHVVDAVSQGEFIPQGTTIVVIQAEGSHVVVKKAEPNSL